MYWECRAGAQINFPESGRGLGHVTATIFGSTVGYPSDSLASCLKYYKSVCCNLYVAVISKRKRKAETVSDSTQSTGLEASLASICSYFQQRRSDADEDVFAKYLSSELQKISAQNIKQKVKRKLLEVVLDGVEDIQQKQQQLPQYFMLSEDGSLQVVNVPVPEQ